MKIKEILFASHNQGKIKEIKEILAPLNISIKTAEDIAFPDIEETGTTFAENALQKAQAIARYTNIICLADDSGLCVDALNGRPGIYSARYAPNRDFDKGMDMLLKEMQQSSDPNRRAHLSCAICLAYPNGTYHLFEGEINGSIADHKMAGRRGFGYDPLFVPEGYTCSFAQLSEEEKNKISHRGRAMQKLKDFLANL